LGISCLPLVFLFPVPTLGHCLPVTSRLDEKALFWFQMLRSCKCSSTRPCSLVFLCSNVAHRGTVWPQGNGDPPPTLFLRSQTSGIAERATLNSFLETLLPLFTLPVYTLERAGFSLIFFPRATGFSWRRLVLDPWFFRLFSLFVHLPPSVLLLFLSVFLARLCGHSLWGSRPSDALLLFSVGSLFFFFVFFASLLCDFFPILTVEPPLFSPGPFSELDFSS